MEEPPIIQAEPAPDRKTGLGRIGLCFSLAPLAALAVMMLLAAWLRVAHYSPWRVDSYCRRRRSGFILSLLGSHPEQGPPRGLPGA